MPKKKQSPPKIYQAEIISEGIPGQREPSARLEDGREFPMGWNMGQKIPIGTKGTARFITTSSMGLWEFKLIVEP